MKLNKADRQNRINEVLTLNNYTVRHLGQHNYRINERISIYPVGGKYQLLSTNEFGIYPVGRLKEFLQDKLIPVDVNNSTECYEKIAKTIIHMIDSQNQRCLKGSEISMEGLTKYLSKL